MKYTIGYQLPDELDSTYEICSDYRHAVSEVYFPWSTEPSGRSALCTAEEKEAVEACQLEELNYISEDYLIPYLTYIQENRKVFAIALTHARNFEFEAIYKKMYRHIFQPILERFRFPTAEQPYVMAFYINGITAIVAQWVQNDCNESIETICGILEKCILGTKDFSSTIE